MNATFDASADILERSHEEAARDALQLLGVLSMLHSGTLPSQIFKSAWERSRVILRTDTTMMRSIDSLSHWHVSRLPGFISTDTDTWDDYRLLEASTLLASLSLISQDSSFGLSMHPLTHAWAKDRQNPKQQGQSWIGAGCVVTLSSSISSMWLRQEKQLRPHVQSYLDIDVKTAFSLEPEAMVMPIFLQCGWILLQMRDDSRLGQLLQDLFVKFNIDKSSPSLQYLPIYDLESRSLVHLGQHRKAVKLLEHVVGIQKTTLAEDHPDRLASQHALGSAYQANRQVREAVKLLEHVVGIRETTLAEDHPDRLASQHALGSGVSFQRAGQGGREAAGARRWDPRNDAGGGPPESVGITARPWFCVSGQQAGQGGREAARARR